MHVSFLWDDKSVNQRHSDYILSMGWVKAGYDVLYFDYRGNAELYDNDAMNTLLVDAVVKHKPDILWFTKPEGASKRFGRKAISCSINPKSIQQMRHKGYKGTIVHWFLDQRYDYFKRSLDVGRECDWFFYVAGGDRLVNYSKQMDTPASFICSPYEPSFMSPKDFSTRTIDLIWMGGDHKPSGNKFEDTRYSLLHKMVSTKTLTDYYGCFSKPKTWCPEYQALLGNSKMCLSLYAFDRPMYFSNRVPHAMGSGCAVFSYDFKDRRKIFDDCDGIFFKTFDEFKKKLTYYKNNPKELEAIANNGYEKAKKYFTSSKVVEEILYTLRNGKSDLPFGETHNPKELKYDIPESTEEFGDIYYLDACGNVLTIDQYSDKIKTKLCKADPRPRRPLRLSKRNGLRHRRPGMR